MTVPFRVLVAGVVATAALSGCTTASEPPPPAPLSPAPAPSELVDELMHPGHVEDPGTAPTISPASDAAARIVAAAALTVYLTPAERKDWYLALEPYLSPDSYADYGAIDPAPLPTGTVTAEPVLIPQTTPYLVTAVVDTTAGPFSVLLQRLDEHADWAVVKIQRERDE